MDAGEREEGRVRGKCRKGRKGGGRIEGKWKESRAGRSEVEEWKGETERCVDIKRRAA